MMKHIDMISLIGDLYMDAYTAGSRTDIDTIQQARRNRDRLYAAIRELYQELDDREEYLTDQQREIEHLRGEITHLAEENERRRVLIRQIVEGRTCEGMKTRLSDIYGSKLTDPDNPDSPLWSDYEPGPDDIPDDGGKFSEQDLPFPDVENLAGASELLGGDE